MKILCSLEPMDITKFCISSLEMFGQIWLLLFVGLSAFCLQLLQSLGLRIKLLSFVSFLDHFLICFSVLMFPG